MLCVQDCPESERDETTRRNFRFVRPRASERPETAASVMNSVLESVAQLIEVRPTTLI